MPESPEPEGSPRLLTTAEIAAAHDVSRQTIHAYRRAGVFPSPVEGEGSTRLRFRENEVVAFFDANPKQPRKKRVFPSKQQGENVTTAVDSHRVRVVDLDNPGGRQSLTDLIQSKWDSEASAPNADMAVDMVYEWLSEWDDERHHRADTLRAAADALVEKYGVTNRAAAELRNMANQAESQGE